MNEQILQVIIDYLDSQVNGEASAIDVKQHLSQQYPEMDNEFMDYIIGVGDKKGLFHRSTMYVNGILRDVIYLPSEAVKMPPNRH